MYLNYLIGEWFKYFIRTINNFLSILDVFQIISLEIIVTSDSGKYNNRVRVF